MYQMIVYFELQAIDDPLYYELITLNLLAFVCINPFVYIAFNSELRVCFLEIFWKHHSSQTVSSRSTLH
jgi:hypothetical protein